MKNKKLKLLSFLLVSFSFFIDQIAKFLVLKNIDLFSSGIKVFIGLNLVYVENKGVSFGLFSDYNIPFIKLPSAMLTNHDLLKACVEIFEGLK